MSPKCHYQLLLSNVLKAVRADRVWLQPTTPDAGHGQYGLFFELC